MNCRLKQSLRKYVYIYYIYPELGIRNYYFYSKKKVKSRRQSGGCPKAFFLAEGLAQIRNITYSYIERARNILLREARRRPFLGYLINNGQTLPKQIILSKQPYSQPRHLPTPERGAELTLTKAFTTKSMIHRADDRDLRFFL